MEESIGSFFEHWIEEFVRSVQMFTGETPTVSQKAPGDKQIDAWEAKLADFQWWQQETEGSPKFKVWVGAAEATGTALGGGTDDGNDPKALFNEMLGQATQGSAAVISASFPKPVRFQAGTPDAPASLRPLRLAQVSLKFRDTPLPDLLIVLEPAAAKVLDGPEAEDTPQEQPAPPSSPTGAPPLKPNTPMFDRLMDLQLPLSVVLGQATMPIRDVLKIASGSVIELDRRVGDYVEVMVHGTVVARGEIVSVKGNYGVRIKEVISRRDRYALKDVA